MNNTMIILRHAETKKDEKLPVSQWALTDEGIKASSKLVENKIFDDVDIIIASGEKKAYQTATPIAQKLNKKIIRIQELNEINRDKGGMLTKEEYEEMKVKIFEDFNFTKHGWETSGKALKRFKEAMDKINNKYEGKKILVVAHGTVMTLYFSLLQNELNKAFIRWKSLDFCDYGIVRNNKVIKNIV